MALDIKLVTMPFAALNRPSIGLTQSNVFPEAVSTYLPSMKACVRIDSVPAIACQSCCVRGLLMEAPGWFPFSHREKVARSAG